MSKLAKKVTRRAFNVTIPEEREPCHDSLAICQDLVSNDLLDLVLDEVRRKGLNTKISAYMGKYVQLNAFKILNKKL